MLAGVLRKYASLVGELLITAGVVMLLYVAYTLWFTNSVSDATTSRLSQSFIEQIEKQRLEPAASQAPLVSEAEEPEPQPDEQQVAAAQSFQPLEPFALLYIPRLRNQVWAEPLVSGISYRALASGVGHYPSTELPGEVGNFAIAGHRATNGEPFAYFERLEVGDRVFVQTLEGWFEYELRSDKIIQETEVWVLDDNPEGQGFEPGSRLITLTTCDPRWNSYQRWAWWGELVASYPLTETPEEIEARS
jgi:sortase A